MSNLKICCTNILALIGLLAPFTIDAQYDAALQINTIAASPVKYGTSVPFNITVYNQGPNTIDDMDVIVYSNSGFSFIQASNVTWAPEGSIANAFVTNVSGPFASGESAIVTINLVAQPANNASSWNIAAEIFNIRDVTGMIVNSADTDSPHDKINNNDAGGALNQPSDDAINGNGAGAVGSAAANTDEDDHDVAKVRIFDVALRKVMTSVGPFEYGDIITFETIVFNQGNEKTGQVTIQELLTEGYIWDPTLNTPLGWTGTPPKPKYTFSNLLPGQSITIPVKLILSDEAFDGLAWNNYTEIFSVRDTNAINMGANEADSTPNSNSAYENQVLPGSLFDNEISGNGEAVSEDEDDHDVAAPRIFDLAMKKERTTAVPSYSYTQNVTYVITVYNQGNVTANQFTLTDTLPCGLEFLSGPTNPGWSVSSAGKISFTSSTPLLPASNMTFNLVFGVNPCYVNPKDGWTNYMEISNAVPADGGSNDDIDGTFDNIFKDDFQYNNLANNDIIDGLGGSVNEDEDNHDLEMIQVVDFALKKRIFTPPPYSYGQNLTFRMTLFNQGNVVGKNIKVKDYVPEGFEFLAASNPLWNPADTTFTYAPLMNPLDTVNIDIVLKLKAGNSRKDWFNYAQIVNVQDTFNNNRFDDADSFPSTPDANEFNVEPGQPADNNIFVLGPANTNVDEDDNDPAGFEVFDLALTKTVQNPAASYPYGSAVTFRIDVINEGGTTASLIEITDYLPCGFSFSQAGNPGWSQVGSNLKFTSTNFLLPGQTFTVFLVLTVQPCANPANAWTNVAEISNSLDSLATPNDDIDSDADDIPGNDPPGEDDIDGTTIDIFDLALTKIVLNQQASYMIGNTLTFQIQVTNQGNVAANSIKITDYLRCGYTFNALSNVGWSLNGSTGYLEFTIPNLLPGQTQNINLILTIASCGTAGAYSNGAEISTGNTPTGSPGNDVDSTPDSNPNNDPPNEDDSDIVDVNVVSFASVGDFVWHDINGNGLQDGGEPGIPNVVVRLFNSFEILVQSTVTNANGLYKFDNVNSGNYYIQFIPDSEYSFIDANIGGNDNTDSDVTAVFGSGTTSIFAVAGVDITNIDAGIYLCVKIGELVWYDFDKDDTWDATENGINGMPVKLFRRVNNSFVLYATVYTGHKPGTPSDDGYFKFCAPPGTYYIMVEMPPIGLVQAKANILGFRPLTASNEHTNDSDLTNNFGPNTTESFTVVSGQMLCNIGAGYYPMATVGNLVWEDSNQNGIQENNEAKIANVLVEAFNSNQEKIGESYTNSDGIYKIEYLRKEDYFLRFTPPDGYGMTLANNSNNDDNDSDVDHSFGLNTTKMYSLQPETDYINIDAGLSFGVLPVKYASIRAIWHGDFNMIDWSTLSEINAATFEIERWNETNQNWALLGSVRAKGNSSQLLNYSYRDDQISDAGLYTYRLAQKDVDGKIHYSEEVSVFVNREQKISAHLFPNPSASKITISVSGNEKPTTIEFYNNLGVKVLENDFNNNKIEIDVSLLPKGNYLVKAIKGSHSEYLKLIVIE